jgi:hypothetical protein
MLGYANWNHWTFSLNYSVWTFRLFMRT